MSKPDGPTPVTPPLVLIDQDTPPPEATLNPFNPAPRRDLSPGESLGCYRIEYPLGVGGMGAVYLATDTQLGRRVAVKVMRAEMAVEPEARGRFVREARATAAISHDHVVPIYAVGEDAGIPYLVMPLLRGESLDARLRDGPWPTIAEACRIGREVAAGLAAAHSAGLVHRDVKPSNVWLDAASGRTILLDFGLARQVRGGDVLTRLGAVLGTPDYMSPEQAAGGEVDHRSDVFGLGAVLYELATAVRPFAGDSVLAVLTNLAVNQPPPAREVNPAVPVELSRLIDRMLAKHPAGRPASAKDVADALARIEARLHLPADRPSAATVRVSEAVTVAGGVAVVAAGLSAYGPSWSGPSLAPSLAALSLGMLMLVVGRRRRGE